MIRHEIIIWLRGEMIERGIYHLDAEYKLVSGRYEVFKRFRGDNLRRGRMVYAFEAPMKASIRNIQHAKAMMTCQHPFGEVEVSTDTLH